MPEDEEQTSEDAGTETTRRETSRIHGLRTGERNTITVRGLRYHMLEMEDVNFHFDSAVLLPDFGKSAPQPGTPEQDRITGLGVLYACYKHAREHPDQKMLVPGHTDRSGPASYNVMLSALRANNVVHVLMGERKEWVDICLQKHKVEDYQQILKWVAYNWRWDCDPGPITNQQNAQTYAATKSFQKRYNNEFDASIGEDGVVGKGTWGAFFDVYMRELELILGTDKTGLEKARQAIHFLDDEDRAVGCGENFPITSENKSATDRRVELLFFDPDEEPEIECLPPIERCNPSTCELYNSDMYEIIPIPAKPLPAPSGEQIIVSLKLAYTDPEGVERNFPENFPVTVEFPDVDYPDDTPQNEQVGKNGMLTFPVLREKKSFTLRFLFSATRFIASAPRAAGIGQPEELIAGSQVKDYHDRDHRLFSLPLDWGLPRSDWKVEDTAGHTPDYYKDPNFTNLENITGNIGSDAAPVEMLLDPHWQYLKFLYFDRFLKHEMTIPPIIIEGFSQASATGGAPETQSNWIAEIEECQCLPWIIQKDAGGTSAPKPDGNVLVQFRTAANTFIDSSGSSRRLVTGGSGGSSADPGLNSGDPVNTNFGLPSGERLKFYDLPAVWKSRTYFARLSEGTGSTAVKEGLFEKLVIEETTELTPLYFSLDDMVLFFADPATGNPGKPLNLYPHNDQVALFCNTFESEYADGVKDTTNLSSIGLYKPDSKRPYISKVETVKRGDTLAYFADYPDWTRLVIAWGNFFDAFDKRTPDGASGVVGARAAVCYIDVFSKPGASVSPRTLRPAPPAPTVTNFCTVQPLHEQRHDIWASPTLLNDHIGIGRFDMVFLRCCDIASDGATEETICLNYFRFFFNFHSDLKPLNNPKAKPYGLKGDMAQMWVSMAIQYLLLRWNGPDDPFNAARAKLLPVNASPKIQVSVVWFAQSFPLALKRLAHFEAGVYHEDGAVVRAFMDTMYGTTYLDKTYFMPNFDVRTPGGPGGFVFAHETAHGGSLGDEYIEPTTPPGLPAPTLNSFDSYSPGSPYYLDRQGIMSWNKFVRARCFWHLAEWLRHLMKNVDFQVKHGGFTYKLPHHFWKPNYSFTHVNWPIDRKINVQKGEHGNFDIVFYPLGEEAYSANVLPGMVTSKPKETFDGIIVVVVKMEFYVYIKDTKKIHTWFTELDKRINLKFNGKYVFQGSVKGKSYKHCLLHFSPRYLIPNYSAKLPLDKMRHIRIMIKPDAPNTWDKSNKHDLHYRVTTFTPLIHEVYAFTSFFRHMVGLKNSTIGQASSYAPIARQVMPDATLK